MKFNKILAGTLTAAAVLAGFPLTASIITAETVEPAMETFETGSDTWKEETSGNEILVENFVTPEVVYAAASIGSMRLADAVDYTEPETETETETETAAVTEAPAAEQAVKDEASANNTVVYDPVEPEVYKPAVEEQKEEVTEAPTEPVTEKIPETAPATEASMTSVETTPVSSSGCLTQFSGVFYGPSGKETYYNLNMAGVVSIMRNRGYDEETYPYWVRDDGVKMLGSYVMVAANLDIRPRGSLIETSLGTAIVCDTGGFAAGNPTQLDIAVTW